MISHQVPSIFMQKDPSFEYKNQKVVHFYHWNTPRNVTSQCWRWNQHTREISSDVNKDWTHKDQDKDKDKDLTYKDSKQKRRQAPTLIFLNCVIKCLYKHWNT